MVSQKSQAITFGGNQPYFELKLGNGSLQWVNRVKYLGCYFLSLTGKIDTSAALGKFFGTFNNIMNVAGYGRNELTSVHLVSTYCLSSLLYSCEIWSLLPHELQPLSVAWNNSFRKIFNCCWRENPGLLFYYCHRLPVSYLIDQRRLLFWKQLIHSGNCLLQCLAVKCLHTMVAVAAKYGITEHLLSISCYLLKAKIWSAFQNSLSSFLR